MSPQRPALEGAVGRVTGKVGPGTVGEITLTVEGESRSFYAYPADGKEVIQPGTRAVVIDFEPPRTVSVTSV